MKLIYIKIGHKEYQIEMPNKAWVKMPIRGFIRTHFWRPLKENGPAWKKVFEVLDAELAAQGDAWDYAESLGWHGEPR